MKKHLLKTMLTALILLMGGVNGAWAQGDETTVTYDFTSYSARTLTNSNTRAYYANSVYHHFASNFTEVHNRFAFQFAGVLSVEDTGLYVQREKGDHVGILGLSVGDKVTINFSQGDVLVRGAVPNWGGTTSDWTNYTTGTEITTSVAGNLSFQAKNSCKITSIVIKTTATETMTAPTILSETYGSARRVTIKEGESSLLSGVSTYYTIDGSTPTALSAKYTEPFDVTETTTVKAITISNSSVVTESAITTEIIDMDAVEVPTASITSVDGITRTVTFSCATEGAMLYYSTDNGENYTEGNSLVISEDTNIKVKAIKGSVSSESENLAFEAGTAITLNAPSYAIGAYSDNTYTLTLFTDQTSILLAPAATISYAIDGGEEVSVSSGTAVQVSVGSEIKMWSVCDGYTKSSEVIAKPSFIDLSDYTTTWSTDFKAVAMAIQPTYNSSANLTLSTDELVPGYYTITDNGFNDNFGVNKVAWQVRNYGSGKEFNTGLWPYNVNGYMAITNLSAGAIVIFTADKAVIAKANVTEDAFLSKANGNYTFIVDNDGIAEFNTTKSSYIYSVTVYEKIPTGVATPTFSPDGGEFTEAKTVTLSCETPGATIYYSIDDNDPTTEYTTPIVISETTTIKAIAKIGDISSAVATATYTFKAAEEPTNIAVLPAADGWNIITALPENIGDYYYALVDNGGELMLSLARGNKQEDNYNSLYYKTAANALVDKSMLFTLESFDGSVVMTNAEYNGYFLQTEYEKANFYRTHDNGGGNKNWGKVNFVYSEDDRCWTVQNGQYAVENGNYLGVWDDNAAPANGKELALDKPANMKGTYRLYAISKADAETYHNKLKTLADYSEGNPVDMTALIVNPNAHFWTGSAPFGWTTTGVQNINKGEGPDGFPGIFEYSDWWASTWTGSLKQTIEVPNGVYELKAYFMAADGVTAYLTANNDKSENLTQFGADPRFPEQLSVRTTVTNGRIEIGAFAEASAVNRWVNTDNFTLTFIEGNPIEDYVTAYESALQNAISKKEAPMNVNVKSNLESVIAEYTGVNEENISELIVATAALQEAIAPVDVSIAAYADAKAALDAMKAVMDGTNVYTEEAFAAYNDVYTTKLAAYNDGTLTDDEAKAIENPEKTTGYRAANIVDNFLLSAWDTEPDFPEGVGYYINTWSTEGNGDGSNFTVPFFEYWTENVNSLGTKTMTATVEDLPEGLYGVRALVRVRVKNGATDAANGITLQVNDGTTTDVCAGEKVGSTQFVLKEYIASGIVGADGKMTVKLIVAEDNNISWLAFKNIKYFLMGDVNGEEGVTTTDAVMAIDFALEKSAPTFAQFAAADVNKSGDITVSDAVAIVNIALNEESVTEARSAEAGVNHLTMENSGIGLVNTTGFSAFQMDVTLSDGAVLSAARLTERAAGLILTSHQVGLNTWRIAALSLDGSTISGSEGALLNLDIAGQGSVSVSNVEFADRAAHAYKLGFGTPTAIDALYNNKEDGEVYTVSGVRSNGVKKGINVVRRADGSVRKMLVK